MPERKIGKKKSKIGSSLVSAPKALYRYFKPVSKSLPDTEGWLSDTLPSATIKAAREVANEAVLAASKQPKFLRNNDV